MNDAKYIGLDVHQATISAAVLDSAGKLLMEAVLETKAETILQFLHGLRGSLHVTLEEGTCAAWLHDLITNLVFDADVVVNAANCRSLSDVVLSGAIKNMFGAMLGTRRSRLHGMFPRSRDFSQVLVDIYRVIRPQVSFLDLTSVIEAQSLAPEIQPVGLMLGIEIPLRFTLWRRTPLAMRPYACGPASMARPWAWAAIRWRRFRYADGLGTLCKETPPLSRPAAHL